MPQVETVRTPALEIAYEQAGPDDAYPIVLVHGFPYDPKAFGAVASILNADGFRTIVPYVRGYGGTRFLSSHSSNPTEIPAETERHATACLLPEAPSYTTCSTCTTSLPRRQ